MAEETDKPNLAGQSNLDPNSKAAGGDDMIDLEGLVRDIDLTPTDSISVKAVASSVEKEVGQPNEASVPQVEVPKNESSQAAEPEDAEEPLHAEALDSAKLDEILNIEDPEMAAQVEAIRAAGFKKGETDAAIEDDEEAGEILQGLGKPTFRQKVAFKLLKLGTAARSFKTFAIHSVKDSRGLLKELLRRTKTAALAKFHEIKSGTIANLVWFKSRSLMQKLSLFASFGVLGLLIFVGAKTIQGTLLPKVQRSWVASFADHADGKFTYDTNGNFEDFNDPLLHPEFVILVERIVVNLSRTPEAPESANPMAAFELYLQTDNQDAAIEVKDRSVEIRDAVSRSVERMTYPDLADEDGKAKLKLLIRKDLNEILTRGKVRRVFFKTIVLNPES